MDVSALLVLRGKIDAILTGKRKELESQLAALSDGDKIGSGRRSAKTGNAIGNSKAANGRAGKRAKAKAKYQSKKDKSVKWSGRGMTPIWMREEMKGTKLKKDDFLIK
jgi:DNA-binding protein H-NS